MSHTSADMSVDVNNTYLLDNEDGQDRPFPLGLFLAVGTGCFYAASANLVSYVAHQAHAYGRQYSRACLWCVDIVAFAGYVVGGLIVTAAYAVGNPAVAVTNATMVGTNLLANMILQCALGITRYSKSMRVGTFMFLLANFHLANDGPSERGVVDVGEILGTRHALKWFTLMGAVFVASSIGMFTFRHEKMQSMPKILSWSVMISILGMGTDNVASSFGLLKGWTLISVLAAYAVVSVFTLMASSKAPAVCEAAVYVPLQLCCQLILNMATGIVIWKDNRRVANLPTYLADFVLAVLSVYLASDNVDLFAGMSRWRVMRHPMSETKFGRAVLRLLASWERDTDEKSPKSKSEANLALKDFLLAGMSRGIFDADSVATLVAAIHAENHTGASVPVVQWIEDNALFTNYMNHHHEFADVVRKSLPMEEQQRLRQRSFDEDDWSNPEDSDSNDETSTMLEVE